MRTTSFFFYLHYPDRPYKCNLYENNLCSELVVEYFDANFVCWGEMVNDSERFYLNNALSETIFPSYALVMSTPNKSLVVLQVVMSSPIKVRTPKILFFKQI